jgi:hypothetical protein
LEFKAIEPYVVVAPLLLVEMGCALDRGLAGVAVGVRDIVGQRLSWDGSIGGGVLGR